MDSCERSRVARTGSGARVEALRRQTVARTHLARELQVALQAERAELWAARAQLDEQPIRQAGAGAGLAHSLGVGEVELLELLAPAHKGDHEGVVAVERPAPLELAQARNGRDGKVTQAVMVGHLLGRALRRRVGGTREVR